MYTGTTVTVLGTGTCIGIGPNQVLIYLGIFTIPSLLGLRLPLLAFPFLATSATPFLKSTETIEMQPQM